MKREYRSWYSDRLQREMNIRVYGHTGTPLLILPTQDSMCDNFENFGMIDTVRRRSRRARSSSSPSTRWTARLGRTSGATRLARARQEDYYNYLIEEVLPFIRTENGTGRLPIAVGCSLGGLHAAIVFLRRPDLFGGMMSLSASTMRSSSLTAGKTGRSTRTHLSISSRTCPPIIRTSPSTTRGRSSSVSARAAGRTRGAARRPSCATSSRPRAFTPGWTSGATMSTTTGAGGRSSCAISCRTSSVSRADGSRDIP